MKAAVLAGVALLAGLLTGLLTACTSSSSPSPDVTRTRTVTSTHGPTPPVPVRSGPTTSAREADCPLLAEHVASHQSGMRLARVTVQRSGGHVVGCRFYPIPGPTAACPASCYQGEHLPPADQPAIEIDSQRYTTAVGAHNAFVLIASKGTAPQQVQVAKGNTGVCYQTHFWSKDHGRDIACAFSTGTTAVVVKTVVVHSSLDVVELAKDVVKKF